jgi:hypothetical protein
MPSPEVLSALETLHKEIDKLQPAIRHVEAAVTLTQTLEKLPAKHVEFLDALKNNDEAHKELLTNGFQNNIAQITDEANRTLEVATSAQNSLLQIVENVTNKLGEHLKQLQGEDKKYKDAIKTVFEEQIGTIAQETEKLQKTAAETHGQISAKIEQTEALLVSIENYYKQIQQINFPERLDKLDSTVAGIMAAVQAVQSRLDNLERNIADQIKELREYQKDSRTALENNLAVTKKEIQASQAADAKKQQTLTFITWGLVIIGIVVMIIR